MKRLFAVLGFILPVITQAAEFQSSLVVQTGELRESDLIVRNITDLTSKKTCLAFYIRTSGTSPVMTCYEATSGFGAVLNQVGHIKKGDLVIRKLEDLKNGVACLVAYVSTPGTSPGVACFPSKHRFKDTFMEDGHVREGDLSMRRIVDGPKTCLVAFVSTKGTSPSVACYDTQVGGKGGIRQVSHLREGDLVVRKVLDTANRKACLVTYVSTEGTSSYIYCFDD